MELLQGQFFSPRLLARAWGQRRIVKVAVPTEGKDVIYTCPGGKITIPISLTAELKTSAEVATRHISLRFLDGAENILGNLVGGVEEGANNEWLFSWTREAGFRGLNDASQVTAPMPAFLLEPGNIIRTLTAEMKPKDTWLKPILWVEEYYLGSNPNWAVNEELKGLARYLGQEMMQHAT